MDFEVKEPQREPIQFNINIDGASSEVVEVVEAIRKVAERVLYHWGVFPIVLPPPLAVLTPDVVGDSNNRKSKPLNLRDLFVTPSFEELDAVASDPKGNPQKLNAKQLQSICDTGEFDVESLNFPGQVHRWRLSQLLQKGTQKIHATLLQDIALAVRLIAVTARSRLHSHFFSVTQSVRALLRGCLLLLDAFIGIPMLAAKNLDARIREERSKYLVAELTVQPNLEDDLDNLCQFVKHQIRKQTMEKYRLENEHPPPVPYLYQTPKKHEIDLRLFNKDIIRKVLPIIAGILEKESRGWFLPFREKIIAELKNKKIPDDDIERQANIVVLDEYIQRVFASISDHPDIKVFGSGIGVLLVEQAQSVILMHRAVDNVQRRLTQKFAQLRKTLEETHPVLSLIDPWMREKFYSAEMKFISDHEWDAHEEALALCREHNLNQTVYFLQRDLAFMREREPILKQELSRVRNPTRIFYWRTQIWCPHHWRVRKVFQGQNEIVATVINRTSSSLAQPRSDPNQPVYLVEKQKTRTTTTRWPFWRWVNYCYRTWAWAWNAMFLFGVVIPWCSPFSLRALFSIRPFMPDLELNQLDGTLYPRKSSLTHTLCSRLIALWRHISKSRTEFESRPDTGFIGKGFSRHLNRTWNYVVKGALGTLLLLLAFPSVCLLSSGLSLIIAILAPFWMPLSTLFFHLCMMFAYDFDSPSPIRNKNCIVLEALFWHILIQGILQPILALFIAFIICPLGSLFVLIMAMLRCSLRVTWDGLMFHLLIKHRGRIPACDSWLVRRIAGPGLSDGHYFKIRPEQALAAFEAKLETEELNAFREEVERIIIQPQYVYSEFMQQCFQPFSGTLCKEGVYRQLEKEQDDLLAALKDQVDRRKKELQTGLNVSTRSKIKLCSQDLHLTVRQAAIMLEKFYPIHVLRRLQISETQFWESKGLAFQDWASLAAQMLSELFSAEFLTPLEETNIWYELGAQVDNLHRYTEMLQNASLQTNIDVTRAVHTPKGNIHVHSPYLDLSTFSPLSSYTSSSHRKDKQKSWYPWKRKRHEFKAEKLIIPLPIPHPSHIAVIIFNRENEEPIPLESDICFEILKAIGDSYRNTSVTGYIRGTPLDGHSLTSDDCPETGTAGSEDCFSHTSLSRSQSQSQQMSGSIIVNLASTEDITLEPDGQRVTYSHSSYSTTV